MHIIGKFFAEIVGTFIFLSIIILSVKAKSDYELSSAWLKISVGLAGSIILVSQISGGNLNPAVSFMMYLNNVLTLQELGFYVVAQLIGATMAYFFYRFLKVYKNEIVL